MKTQGGCGTFRFTSPPLHESQSALLWHSVGHLLESVRLHFHFSSPSSFPFLRWKWHSVQLGRTEALHPSSQLLTPRPPLLPDATEGHQEGLLRHDRRWRGRRYDQIRRTQFLWAHFLWANMRIQGISRAVEKMHLHDGRHAQSAHTMLHASLHDGVTFATARSSKPGVPRKCLGACTKLCGVTPHVYTPRFHSRPHRHRPLCGRGPQDR